MAASHEASDAMAAGVTTRHLLSSAGVVIALGFMAVSAVMNWRYGLSLGRDPIDRYAYAVTHVLGDALKTAVPFFCWWAIRNRIWAVAAAAAMLWCLCTAYSVSSLLGYADLNRQTAAGVLSSKADGFADLRRELDRKQDRLATLGSQDPAAAIERRLEGVRQNAKWSLSRQCTEARGDARGFCTDYSNLRASLARAEEAERLEQEIVALRTQLANSATVGRLDRSGDPQAGAVVRLTGWELIKVQTGLSLLLVAVLEFASSFGLFVALNHGELTRGQLPPDARSSEAGRGGVADARSDEVAPTSAAIAGIAKFARSRLKPAPGKSVAVDAVYRVYLEWCEGEHHPALVREEFEAALRAFVEQGRARGACVRLERSGNRVYCREMQLAA